MPKPQNYTSRVLYVWVNYAACYTASWTRLPRGVSLYKTEATPSVVWTCSVEWVSFVKELTILNVETWTIRPKGQRCVIKVFIMLWRKAFAFSATWGWCDDVIGCCITFIRFRLVNNSFNGCFSKFLLVSKFLVKITSIMKCFMLYVSCVSLFRTLNLSTLKIFKFKRAVQNFFLQVAPLSNA